MKIIKNNAIPFSGFSAMAIYPFIFVRKDWVNGLKGKEASQTYQKTIRHENIHFAQQKEMLLFFYLWYVIEWIIRLFINGFSKAYSRISFEQEAYKNQQNKTYLKNRAKYSWTNYLTK